MFATLFTTVLAFSSFVSAAPAITQPASSSIISGSATWFNQDGFPGACGSVHSNSDLVTSIHPDRYGSLNRVSPLCGHRVNITNTNNRKSVTAVIASACQTCINANSLDLSTGAFQQIASLGNGIIPITWDFI